MISVPMMEAMMVARNTAPHSIPVWLRMLGFTAMIYAIVKKVVRPAMISVETVVPLSLSLKNFSKVKLLPFPSLGFIAA